MQDLKIVRQRRIEYMNAIKNKGIDLNLDHLLWLEDRRLKLQKELNGFKEKKNILSKAIAKDTGKKDDLLKDARANAKQIAILEKELRECLQELEQLKLKVPGLPKETVPIGNTEENNLELYRIGELNLKTQDNIDHLEILKMHNMVDQKGAARIGGARAYALKNYGALLENAVLRFAYDHILQKGFMPVHPPVMVRHNAMEGTGYFPFGEDNAYYLAKDKMYLTGTAEVGILALNMDKCFNHKELPIRIFGTSTCFRREAGNYGRDTRGLYRVHQFQKVEQVVICPNDDDIANHEHLNLLQNAKEILEALELPFRVVECCTKELGLGQVRKFDIETWMPGRKAYCETHSASNFDDFQARRLNIKYEKEDKKKQYVYTLNNTAIATPRILIPILENHLLPNGNIYVPEALRPYLNGITEIERQND